MKRTALLVLVPLLTVAPLFAQDDSQGQDSSQEYLQNSTFSDGTTYWHGDCKPAGADMATDFTSNNSGASGIVVDLHSSSWTSIKQEIRDKPTPPNAVLTLTYQVSSDFKLSDRDGDYGNFAPSVGFPGANIPSETGKIVAFIDVPPLSRSSLSATGGGNTLVTIYDDNVSYRAFAPATDQASHTVTIQMRPPPPTSDSHQTFCLAFPPGSGSVTFTKISLTPGRPTPNQ